MARVWAQPECSSGACVCKIHNEIWGYFVPLCDYHKTDDAKYCYCLTYRNQEQPSSGVITNQTECSSACESVFRPGWPNPSSYFPPDDPCAPGQLNITRTIEGQFYPGTTCCIPTQQCSPGCRFDVLTNLACTANEHAECCTAYVSGCNAGFCLPPSGGDPAGCFNLTTACGNAMGSRLPSTSFPPYCVSEQDPRCVVAAQGCCLCDRCCDMDATACTNMGGTPMPASCSQTSTQSVCTSARVKPACKKATYRAARRPDAHRTGSTINPPRGRWEPCSIAKQKTIDTPNVTGTAECKLSYGFVQRNGGRWEGKFCNTYNNRCASGKRSPTLNMVRNGGRWDFEGKYRHPCPEESEMGCTRTVTCPT